MRWHRPATLNGTVAVREPLFSISPDNRICGWDAQLGTELGKGSILWHWVQKNNEKTTGRSASAFPT